MLIGLSCSIKCPGLKYWCKELFTQHNNWPNSLNWMRAGGLLKNGKTEGQKQQLFLKLDLFRNRETEKQVKLPLLGPEDYQESPSVFILTLLNRGWGQHCRSWPEHWQWFDIPIAKTKFLKSRMWDVLSMSSDVEAFLLHFLQKDFFWSWKIPWKLLNN